VSARQQSLAEREAMRAESIREKTKIADSHEAVWQHVQEEAAQELRAQQRHGALLAAVSIVLPSEGDAFAIESGADDWKWRSGACIDRGSAGPWSDHRRPAWRRPPSLDGAVVAEIDGTVLDQPMWRLVRRSVTVCGDGGASNQRGTYRGIRD